MSWFTDLFATSEVGPMEVEIRIYNEGIGDERVNLRLSTPNGNYIEVGMLPERARSLAAQLVTTADMVTVRQMNELLPEEGNDD